MSSKTDKNDVMGVDVWCQKSLKSWCWSDHWHVGIRTCTCHWKDISVILYVTNSRYKEVWKKGGSNENLTIRAWIIWSATLCRNIFTIVDVSVCIIYSTMPSIKAENHKYCGPLPRLEFYMTWRRGLVYGIRISFRTIGRGRNVLCMLYVRTKNGRCRCCARTGN